MGLSAIAMMLSEHVIQSKRILLLKTVRLSDNLLDLSMHGLPFSQTSPTKEYFTKIVVFKARYWTRNIRDQIESLD